MADSLYSLFQHELKTAKDRDHAICRVMEHQLYLRDQQHADLIEENRKIRDRIKQREKDEA